MQPSPTVVRRLLLVASLAVPAACAVRAQPVTAGPDVSGANSPARPARATAEAVPPSAADQRAPVPPDPSRDAPSARVDPPSPTVTQPLPTSSPETAPGTCVAGPGTPFEEPGGPRAFFSIHGYATHHLPLERVIAGRRHVHCLRVGWPPGETNNEGEPSSVARSIGPSWFRAIENTLARVPWHHVTTLTRIVIDNRPKEHGIAPYDRQSPDDARDGHTLWLHEHLFRDPNHWTSGNHGSYWAYHVNVDHKSFARLPADHEFFSPVLLHELGHLVMYNVVNGGSSHAHTPTCALTCGDAGTCSQISQLEREAGCISPYCMPFRFPAGTENFAEQYRFHYQSAATRDLLSRHKAGCADLLRDQDARGDEPHPAPWDAGLPDGSYRPSLWKSCQGRACKGF